MNHVICTEIAAEGPNTLLLTEFCSPPTKF